MEDATDAERPFVGSVKGGSWDISLLRTVAGGLDLNNPSIPSFSVNQVTLEGDTLAASDIDGYLYDIYEDGSLILSNVIANAEDSGSTIVLGWEGATVPDGISAPTSKIIEIRPGESNRQLLAENDVWAYNSAKGKFQPKQMSSGSQGKMEDATDAALNTAEGYTQYEYVIVAGEPDSSGECAGYFGELRCYDTDNNGLLVPLNELAGTLYFSINGSEFTELAVVTFTDQGGSSPNKFHIGGAAFVSWLSAQSAQNGDIIKFSKNSPTGDSDIPLQDGDAWVYNGSESKFKPTQISSISQGKMEDATDAERNLDPVTNLDPDGYRFKVSPSQSNAGDITPQRLQGWWSNVLDLDNKTIPLSGLDGVEVDVYYDNNAPFRVTMLTQWVGINAYSWDGIGDIRPLLNTVTDVKFVPVDAARVPLQDGDAWVYNGSESKFKPTQISSIISR